VGLGVVEVGARRGGEACEAEKDEGETAWKQVRRSRCK